MGLTDDVVYLGVLVSSIAVGKYKIVLIKNVSGFLVAESGGKIYMYIP